MDLFHRIFEIITKYKKRSPDGDESLQKKLADEIVKLLRAVGKTASKQLQNQQLQRICEFFEKKMNAIKASKNNPQEQVIHQVIENRKKKFASDLMI